VRAEEAADHIAAETKGRVEVKIFPNNQLGGGTDMLAQVRSGAITFFNPSALVIVRPRRGDQRARLRVRRLRPGMESDGRNRWGIRARGYGEGQPVRVREDVGQRIPPDRHQRQADRERQGSRSRAETARRLAC
jgi:extracellular solute-binding protein (family 7)